MLMILRVNLIFAKSRPTNGLWNRESYVVISCFLFAYLTLPKLKGNRRSGSIRSAVVFSGEHAGA
jgi:hypothetical protein